jgi:hypothetical protein
VVGELLKKGKDSETVIDGSAGAGQGTGRVTKGTTVKERTPCTGENGCGTNTRI